MTAGAPARRGGFTLVELLVVCALLGIAAAAAAWSVRRPVAAARAELAADRLLAADGAARTLAVRRGEAVRLRFDPSAGTVTRVGAGGRRAVVAELPLAAVRRAGAPAGGGPVELTVRPDGSAPTYAVRLVGADETAHWLLFAGGAGHAVRLPDAAAVDALLALDAD
ncbi:Tfp pilus assembly protein FimT/FimU [Alienimonas sp. DA493]|uniref:pilus assembly FimT family protein n=1 Tax=Alienimonas sp. DA493 TaxID=3373605 RepID=UPI003754A2E1